MFNRWFRRGRQKKEEIIYSPLNGKVLAMEKVPDPTFSTSMKSLGVAVDPADGTVGSPVDGEVSHIFRTKHAVLIRTESGLEVLIHIGLDTVSMGGEGFQAHVNKGDRVTVGQPLIDFSLELVRRKAASPVTPVLVANGDLIDQLNIELPESAQMGITPLMKVIMKS
ncbi:PTS glucose transporter subunit IIA [Paenibacillus tarimensis]